MSDHIIRYDEAFIADFEKLYEMIEAGDEGALHRFLIDRFSRIFRLFQYYAKEDVAGGVKEFEEVDEETRKELMRPLSHRQYRMIQRSYSRLACERDLIISSIWDFLHDNGRIYEKKVMSVAEVFGASLILEEVYSCLGRVKR